MAKGLRSSKGKANRAKLRCKVFGPVEDARTQRLSVKLLEVASRPRSKAHEDVRSEETENSQFTYDAPSCQDPGYWQCTLSIASTTSEEKPSVVMAQTSMSEQSEHKWHCLSRGRLNYCRETYWPSCSFDPCPACLDFKSPQTEERQNEGSCGFSMFWKEQALGQKQATVEIILILWTQKLLRNPNADVGTRTRALKRMFQ